MEKEEIDSNECPDCKKTLQNPYFVEGCGHLLCKDCAYRRASKWDPCQGKALKFNFSISIFQNVFRFSWQIKRNEYFLINNFKAIKVCFRRFSRRDLRPYDQQKFKKDTTSQVFFATFSESCFETRSRHSGGLARQFSLRTGMPTPGWNRNILKLCFA